MLRSLGCWCVSELPLASGRRADLVALNDTGEVWIVEIKSSMADLRADQKWRDYGALRSVVLRHHPGCAVRDFPKDTGLIVADAYGADIIARRRSIGWTPRPAN